LLQYYLGAPQRRGNIEASPVEFTTETAVQQQRSTAVDNGPDGFDWLLHWGLSFEQQGLF
jgi:hypothetical protein